MTSVLLFLSTNWKLIENAMLALHVEYAGPDEYG